MEQFLGRHVTEEEMRNLTPEDVAPVYKKEYWDRCRCNDLDNGLALFTFDWAVNAGSSKPAKCIQKFVAAKQDGIIGAKTLGLVAEKTPKDLLNICMTVGRNITKVCLHSILWQRLDKAQQTYV